MDNTTITIIGMIAAFLTASITPILTEAVKDYLQHKTKFSKSRIVVIGKLGLRKSCRKGVQSNGSEIWKSDEVESEVHPHVEVHVPVGEQTPSGERPRH